MSFTQVALSYSVTAVKVVAPSALEAALGDVVLPTGLTGDITQIADVSLTNDSTSLAGQVATRTLTFALGPLFYERFPNNSDQKAPFRNLYTAILTNALSSIVTAADPVLS